MCDSVQSRLWLDTPPVVIYTHDDGSLILCQASDLYRWFTERGFTALNSNIEYSPNGYLELAYVVKTPIVTTEGFPLDWNSLRHKKVQLRLCVENVSHQLTLHGITAT